MNKQQVGRLAFRVEDGMWNCYFAEDNTMKDAQLLGSLHMLLAHEPDLKDQFVSLMKNSLARLYQETSGSKVVDWSKPKEAPFWEKKT